MSKIGKNIFKFDSLHSGSTNSYVRQAWRPQQEDEGPPQEPQDLPLRRLLRHALPLPQGDR